MTISVESIKLNDFTEDCYDWYADPHLKAIATIIIDGKIRVSGVEIIHDVPGNTVRVNMTYAVQNGNCGELKFIDADLKLEFEKAVLSAYSKLVGDHFATKAKEYGFTCRFEMAVAPTRAAMVEVGRSELGLVR